jgi:hypothetical protein
LPKHPLKREARRIHRRYPSLSPFNPLERGGAINLVPGFKQSSPQFLGKSAQADAPITVVGKLKEMRSAFPVRPGKAFEFGNRHPHLGLLQGCHDLLGRIALLLHRELPPSRNPPEN